MRAVWGEPCRVHLCVLYKHFVLYTVNLTVGFFYVLSMVEFYVDKIYLIIFPMLLFDNFSYVASWQQKPCHQLVNLSYLNTRNRLHGRLLLSLFHGEGIEIKSCIHVPNLSEWHVGRPTYQRTLRTDNWKWSEGSWEGPQKGAEWGMMSHKRRWYFLEGQRTGEFVNGTFIREDIKRFECFWRCHITLNERTTLLV